MMKPRKQKGQRFVLGGLLRCVRAQIDFFRVFSVFLFVASVPVAGQTASESDFALLKKPGFAFDLNFSQKEERVYRDFRKVPEGRIGLLFECTDISVFQNLTIHSRKGTEWTAVNAVAVNDGKTRVSVRFSLPDGTDGIRISFWRNGMESDQRVEVKSARDAHPRIGVLEKPGDWLCGIASRKVQSALFRGGFESEAFDSVGDAGDYKIVVLPYQPSLTGEEEKKLVRFVRRGGKLICFYQGAAALARTVGLRVLPYRGADTGVLWTDLRTGDYSIPSPTANLIPAEPLTGKPFAVWTDNQGCRTDIPACSLTESGAWFAHLPPLPGTATVDLYSSILRHWGVQPDLERTFGVARAQTIYPKRTGIWFHHPESRHPGGWAGEINTLPEGVTDIFVQLQAAGTVFFTLKGRDVVSANNPKRTVDALPALLAAASNRSIRVHAWVTCFSGEGGDPAQFAQLRNSGRLLSVPQPWLDPAKQINRELVLDGIKALAHRFVDGIHLDYVRYPAAVSEKESQEITGFVKMVSDAVRKINPACLISAAVFPVPETARGLGQNWPAWVADGSVDFVCPMTYSDSAAGFERLLELSLRLAPAEKIWPGIGYSADESQLDSVGMGEQFERALRRKTGGVVIFAADSRLAGEIPSRSAKQDGAVHDQKSF